MSHTTISSLNHFRPIFSVGFQLIWTQTLCLFLPGIFLFSWSSMPPFSTEKGVLSWFILFFFPGAIYCLSWYEKFKFPMFLTILKSSYPRASFIPSVLESLDPFLLQASQCCVPSISVLFHGSVEENGHKKTKFRFRKTAGCVATGELTTLWT